MTADVTAFALQHGQYGYRHIPAMLHRAIWIVNIKRLSTRNRISQDLWIGGVPVL
ncbi:hypothetical protein [Agrobacterium vitis]|uniref:hypothetical protein n=1 Tax=Agrobacterium vitis TaxID=373 RepID=UPI001571C6A7|nr:hypothetical protein [Agrobacterium vitis]